jgi:hypothetical protein
MKLLIVSLISCLSVNAMAEWKIDMTRRQKDLQKIEMEAMEADKGDKNIVDQVFDKEAPKEEVVIANTDKGFVPNILRLKKDQVYQISVVNVNKNKKNVSFMLDAFAEHHGTYFGDVVSFTVKPQKEGLFQFFCPEAEFIGKVLVYGPPEKLEAVPPVQVRQPAQENDEPAAIRGMDE